MPSIHRLKIVLKNTKPVVSREFLVPSDLRLDRLHDVTQIVMGWQDAHLHEFSNGVRGPHELRFGPEPDEFDDGIGPPQRDESKASLMDLAPVKGGKFRYWYDFGDDWHHEVTVMSVTEAKPGMPQWGCLKAVGACPPEDCGGPWGYQNLLAVLADPSHEEYNELHEWIGGDWDPQHCDIVAINKALAAQTAHWNQPARKKEAKT